MIPLSLTVNGERVAAHAEPRTSLADFLRGACGLTGTHLGCEHGVCGACTVMIDGCPMRSCITYAVQVEGCDVRTIEGFDTDEVMDALRTEFSRRHALQCGFCTPGMLITARDIVIRLGNPGEERVREELSGNLCRCTGYGGIVQAVLNVGQELERRTAAPPSQPPVERASLKVAGDIPSDVRQAADASPKAAPGGTEISQSFNIDANIERVWSFFRDLSEVAVCIPGAELLGHDDRNFNGRIQISIGPVRANVAGSGVYKFDDRSKSGTLSGSGQDTLSRSRVQGGLQFRLLEASASSTRVDATITFALQGMLAQFSRSSIAKEFTLRVLNEFAARASAALTDEARRPAGSGLGLMSFLRWWLSSLLGGARK